MYDSSFVNIPQPILIYFYVSGQLGCSEFGGGVVSYRYRHCCYEELHISCNIIMRVSLSYMHLQVVAEL